MNIHSPHSITAPPPSIAALNADRQRMLRSMMGVLSDPSLNNETKTAEVDATLSAIRQIAALAGVVRA